MGTRHLVALAAAVVAVTTVTVAGQSRSSKGPYVVPRTADGQPDTEIKRSAQDLEAVFDVPVTVSAVLGKSAMEVSELLKLGKGTIVELDRKVADAVASWALDGSAVRAGS